MDKVMLDIDAQVKAAIEKTAARMDKCEALLRGVIGEQALRLDAEFQNLKYRSQRLATVSDILNGKAYTVVEGKHHELFVQKGKDAKLISLAEKMGLNAEFIQGKADLP
jgi:hypothetical protein